MGIRQTLNRNPVLSGVIAATIVAAVAALQLKRACSAPRSSDSSGAARQAFFTVDDGNNWFPADASKVPPFKHQGKDAYRVAVFRCGGGKPFASRLERFGEPVRRRLQDDVDRTIREGKPLPTVGTSYHPEMEIKRPGQTEWVRYTPKTAKEFSDIMEVRCPDGSTSPAESVLPD